MLTPTIENRDREPIYVWECTFPEKLGIDFLIACMNVGLDINDDQEVWFSDALYLAKGGRLGKYHDYIVTATESVAERLFGNFRGTARSRGKVFEYVDFWILESYVDEDDADES